MRNFNKRTLFLAAMFVLIFLSSCKNEGPAQEAGRKLDEEADKVTHSVQQSLERVEQSINKKKESREDLQQPQKNQNSQDQFQK